MPKHTTKLVPKGYYVYELTDPANDEVFYVGKGKGRRMYQHAADARAGRVDNVEKHDRIISIHNFRQAVQYRVVADGLTEREAFQLERRRIKHHGSENLTNALGGTWTDDEKAQRRAQHLAARLLPEHIWVALRKPTLAERRLAWEVRQSIIEFAAHEDTPFTDAVNANMRRRGRRFADRIVRL